MFCFFKKFSMFYQNIFFFLKQSLATTHFEPNDARRAFPCFDEPAMKAQFELTMIRHKNFSNTLFNTPLVSSSPYPE